MTYDNYQADPPAMKRALHGIRGNAEAPKEAKARFVRLRGDVDDWNGDDDEFYDKTEPQWLAQNESCEKFIDGVTEFMVGLDLAVNESLRSIGLVHGAVEDRINEARLNADAYRNGGHGKR
ncbi:hypothetical protein [Streptomyces sp. RTd22]|uniref:hypothetical protein n=1 Tax=Streptomyces sp. RTd22 TaxID=1841249 RepID=UPI0007C4A5C5|nr:hypothetical protein [Streptomyces sp. RTd22]